MSSAALAHADGYTVAPRAANLDGRTAPSLLSSLVEEESIPGAAWTGAARLAGYVRMHHANADPVVSLYPLAAYAAATRRVDGDEVGAYGPPRSPTARRTTAVAARGAPQFR